ncbi:MAG: hypothetical protein WCF16_08775 [Alphaproteobacteria bacterium]
MSNVERGQRYRQANMPQDVWEVVAILVNGGAFPHARLQRVRDTRDIKTVSFSALQDKTLFHLVE